MEGRAQLMMRTTVTNDCNINTSLVSQVILLLFSKLLVFNYFCFISKRMWKTKEKWSVSWFYSLAFV